METEQHYFFNRLQMLLFAIFIITNHLMSVKKNTGDATGLGVNS